MVGLAGGEGVMPVPVTLDLVAVPVVVVGGRFEFGSGRLAQRVDEVEPGRRPASRLGVDDRRIYLSVLLPACPGTTIAR